MLKGFGMLNKVLNFSAERYFRAAGDLFIYDGDYEMALAMVNKTLELDPGNVRAQVLKGDILFCLTRDREALDVFNQALQADPFSAEAYLSKAGVLDVLGKSHEALFCCRQAQALIQEQNAYLLMSLYDQTLSLLLTLKKYRQAQNLLNQAMLELPAADARYLHASYKSLIDQSCRRRLEARRKAKTPSLQVI